MKNIKNIIIGILLVVIFGLSLVLLQHKNDNVNEKEIITFNNVKYSGVEAIKDEDFKNYVERFIHMYEAMSVDKFDDNEIGLIVGTGLLNNITPTSEADVKMFVKTYFGIDNYELKPGNYNVHQGQTHLDNIEKIVITKNEEGYLNDLGGYGVSHLYSSFESKEVKGNTVVLHYVYGVHDWTGLEIRKRVGNTDITLINDGNNLYLKSIKYTPVK